MRKLSIILTLLSLAFTSAVSAVEYVTLVKVSQQPDWAEREFNPSDVIEIVGFGRDNDSAGMQLWKRKLGPNENQIYRIHYRPQYRDFDSAIGTKFTGIEKIELQDGFKFCTFKITKASEIDKVGPTSVLVLPENATGNYDLIVESSSDSVTWTPFHSQAVQSDTVKRLFRVRIVHKGQEEAAAKGEEN